jgi:ribonuclease P protein component
VPVVQYLLLVVQRVAIASRLNRLFGMLPADARLRNSSDISVAMRQGTKYSSRLIVMYVAREMSQSTKVAFAVGKSVGNSVVRHLITRRLRHIVALELGQFPVGSFVVVRALPAASTATYAQLEENVGFALAKVRAA